MFYNASFTLFTISTLFFYLLSLHYLSPIFSRFVFTVIDHYPDLPLSRAASFDCPSLFFFLKKTRNFVSFLFSSKSCGFLPPRVLRDFFIFFIISSSPFCNSCREAKFFLGKEHRLFLNSFVHFDQILLHPFSTLFLRYLRLFYNPPLSFIPFINYNAILPPFSHPLIFFRPCFSLSPLSILSHLPTSWTFLMDYWSLEDNRKFTDEFVNFSPVKSNCRTSPLSYPFRSISYALSNFLLCLISLFNKILPWVFVSLHCAMLLCLLKDETNEEIRGCKWFPKVNIL